MSAFSQDLEVLFECVVVDFDGSVALVVVVVGMCGTSWVGDETSIHPSKHETVGETRRHLEDR